MSFQKDPPPPGIYDGACAIAERNPSSRIWKALRLISAEERHQQTYNLGCDDIVSLDFKTIDRVPNSG
jgi:hypothetical protein